LWGIFLDFRTQYLGSNGSGLSELNKPGPIFTKQKYGLDPPNPHTQISKRVPYHHRIS